MPQFEQVDTFVSQIFWLVVCFVFLYLVVALIITPRLRGIDSQRRQFVEQHEDLAEDARTMAQNLVSQAEALRSEAHTRAQAQLNAQAHRLDEEKRAQLQKLDESIAQRWHNAQRDLLTHNQSQANKLALDTESIAERAARQLTKIK